MEFSFVARPLGLFLSAYRVVTGICVTGDILGGSLCPDVCSGRGEGVREEGAALSLFRKQVSFSFSIPVSNFQVCWVWAPTDKAILKHISSENRPRRAVVRKSGLAGIAPRD